MSRNFLLDFQRNLSEWKTIILLVLDFLSYIQCDLVKWWRGPWEGGRGGGATTIPSQLFVPELSLEQINQINKTFNNMFYSIK